MLNGDVLGLAIANCIIDKNASAETKIQIQNLWKKIGTEIVNHIKTNGSVTVASGIPVSTAGSATAQTGATTGTGTGTIS